MISQTDQVFDILMELLQKGRSSGLRLRLRDIEGILPTLGVPLGSDDHFTLLLADLDQQKDNGFPQPLEEVLSDYPHWAVRIREHLDFVQRCRRIGPSLLARLGKGERLLS